MSRTKSAVHTAWWIGALLVVVALIWLWRREEIGPQRPTAEASSGLTQTDRTKEGGLASTASQTPSAASDPQASLPDSLTSATLGEVDAIGRSFNENQDLIGGAVAPAKALPVKANIGEVIGYRKDATGQSTPIRAGDSKQVIPNSPGTYAAVDMWADGGPVVVAPPERPRESEAERRAREQREAEGRPRN